MSRILICTVLMALLSALLSGGPAEVLRADRPAMLPVARHDQAAPPSDDPGTQPSGDPGVRRIGEPGRGEFGWPLPGTPAVVRAFETPTHRYGPGHRGVDLAGQTGIPVLAAGDGTVVFAGPVAGRGVVSIDHPGGLRTSYEPVSPSVATGDVVVRGQQIGTLLAGHPGCPALTCLHWGVRRGVDYLDPLRLLRLVRVRLLPWEDSSP